MNLKLEIRKNNEMILQLADNEKVVGNLAWKGDNNLSRTLLQKIDENLKKNRIELDKISNFEIMSDVPEKWTSCRIAGITLKTLAIAKKYSL